MNTIYQLNKNINIFFFIIYILFKLFNLKKYLNKIICMLRDYGYSCFMVRKYVRCLNYLVNKINIKLIINIR